MNGHGGCGLVLRYQRGSDGGVFCILEVCAGKNKPHATVGILAFENDEQWQVARRAMRLVPSDGDKGVAEVGGSFVEQLEAEFEGDA